MKVLAAAFVIFAGLLSLGLAGVADSVGHGQSGIVLASTWLGTIAVIVSVILLAIAWTAPPDK